MTNQANPRPFDGKTILLTGGTGSFGRQFVRTILAQHKPKALRIYSRDELKQFEMQQAFGNSTLRYFIGDVRDRDRLQTAMVGVDFVIHAAAMKQVPACEYNPFEAVKTNVLGAQNVVETALNAGVHKVLCLSTDKAVNPVNLYGATKLCAEKIFVHGNSYSGQRKTRFSVVRYGNVVGSRGSVIPVFLEQAAAGEITITDRRMTRFWITLPDAVDFVIRCVDTMVGSEIFAPKIPSMRIADIAKLVAPRCRIKTIGIRPGEKLHEILMTEEDGRNAIEMDGMYVILPPWARNNKTGCHAGTHDTTRSECQVGTHDATSTHQVGISDTTSRRQAGTHDATGRMCRVGTPCTTQEFAPAAQGGRRQVTTRNRRHTRTCDGNWQTREASEAPQRSARASDAWAYLQQGKPVPDGFIYSSDRNDRWVTGDELWEMIRSNHDIEPITANLIRQIRGLADSLRTPVDHRRRHPGSGDSTQVRLDHAGTSH